MLFYLTVNTINVDGIIARNNIDMYFAGEELDADYLFNLSTDAAPQIKRFMTDQNGEYYAYAWDFFNRSSEKYNELNKWQSFNISRYLSHNSK